MTQASRGGRSAVFLDRDGTICEEMGYLNHISRLTIFPFAAGAIARLNQAGHLVIVITNQSGVSRGIFPDALVGEVHRRLLADLGARGARIDAFYYCPHRKEDGCTCRKPLPGLLERAAREHDLDLAASFVVGDRYADVAMAHAVKASGILVKTGYGRGELEYHGAEWKRRPDAITEDLTGAVEWILQRGARVASP